MAFSALIIGLGQIGMSFDLNLPSSNFVYSHARALSLHEEFGVLGGVDDDPKKRQVFEKVYEGTSFQSIEDAFEKQAFDLVVVATPTETHPEVLRKILAVGAPKIVLCEKPLAYDVENAREMVSACSELGVNLYANYMRRCDPGALEVKRRIAEKDITGPFSGSVWYSKGFLNNGSHFFNLLECWLGPFKGSKILSAGRRENEDVFGLDALVRFERGDVTFMSLKDIPYTHHSIELFATNGRLLYDNGGQNIHWWDVNYQSQLENYTFLSKRGKQISSELNLYQLRVVDQIVSSLRGEQCVLCTGAQAMQTAKNMNRVLEKAHEK